MGIAYGTSPVLDSALGRVKDYKRIDAEHGEVNYYLSLHGEVFVVGMRRLLIIDCSCDERDCPHGAKAIELETAYQAKHADTPCSCSMCGRMARRRPGLILCPNCAY